jgi:hypothetical protein
MIDWMFIDMIRERGGAPGQVALLGRELTAIDMRAG